MQSPSDEHRSAKDRDCPRIKTQIAHFRKIPQRLHHLAAFDPFDVLFIGIAHAGNLSRNGRDFEEGIALRGAVGNAIPNHPGCIKTTPAAASWNFGLTENRRR